MQNLYITSIDKKDGKTFVSAGIAATMQSLGYKTSVYKPYQTAGIEINGFMQSPDLTFIKSVDPYIGASFTYLFKTDSEPLIAAEAENKYIDVDQIQTDFQSITAVSDCTIIDGDRGLMSPLAPSTQAIDMVKRLQLPVLFVVTLKENTINNTLTSIYTAIDKGVEIRGVVLNNIAEDCSKQMLTSTTRIIEEYTNVSILGLVPNIGSKIRPEDLITGILNGIDIESVFKMKIEKLELN